MAKQANAQDLKFCDQQWSCGFDSRLPHMIVELTWKEFLKWPKYNGRYRLCYVEKIPERLYADANESIIHRFSDTSDWSYHSYIERELDNPDYIDGCTNLYTYFTSNPVFDDQWGDDWNDCPYQDNAGTPYDDISIEQEHTSGMLYFSMLRSEIDVLRVTTNIKSYMINLPEDFSNGLTVQSINQGAAAWIYYHNNKEYRTIYAGCTASRFIKEIELIEKNENYAD